MQMLLSVFPTAVVLLVLTKYVESLVAPIPLPNILDNCFRTRTQNISYSDVPAAGINSYCIKYYLYKTATTRYYAPVGNETIKYAQDLFEKVVKKARAHRKKRQAMSFRREMRSTSPAYRNRLFRRINQLKNRVGTKLNFLLFSFCSFFGNVF